MKSTQPLFRRLAALLFAAFVSAAMSSPVRADTGATGFSWFGGGPRVAGSGKPATERRAVAGFQAITLLTSMKLVLRQGTREGIELRADDNLLPLIETTVVERGGVPTLEIGAKKGSSFSTGSPMVATIDLITLSRLSISGSGDVVGEALKTPVLKVAVSGSGNVKLGQLAVDDISATVSGSGDILFSGHTGKLAVSISGSGDVNTRGLDADDVSVSVAGSGDADVTAHKTLAVSIAGAGNVKYRGDATVTSKVAGHGNVVKR